jgi:sugar-specific transcriptional regulator TrmB
MELHEQLVALGLNAKESYVYVACLQLGAAPVTAIALHANLKRPTTYLVLEALEKQGLVRRMEKGRPVLFQAEEPAKLIQELQLRRDKAQQLLPVLQAMYNVDPRKPHITACDGEDGVRRTYHDIFLYMQHHRQEELLIFGALKDTLQHFSEETIDLFYDLVAKTKCRVRELGNDDHETRRYFRRAFQLNSHHDIRLVRNDGVFVKTDNMLWGNRLSVFSVQEHVFVTTVESPSIAESYRTLFNMAWRSGKRI